MRQATTRGVIRDAKSEDLGAIVAIYNAAIPGRRAVTHTSPVSVQSRLEWFNAHDPDRRPLWVLENQNEILAWIGLQSYSPTDAYSGTAEVSVYVAQALQGQGLGTLLLETMIAKCPALGVDVILGFTFAQNEATIRLNRKLGFEQWGHLREIAKVEGVSRDLLIFGLQTGKSR
jgi:L-amino acid N-acyltransferase YncA